LADDPVAFLTDGAEADGSLFAFCGLSWEEMDVDLDGGRATRYRSFVFGGHFGFAAGL
jgi:hypothetical protein